MIEFLVASLIVGQSQIGPNQLKTEYLDDNGEIITVIESIQEVPVDNF